MDRLQNMLLDILVDVDEVLRRHGVRYYIFFGTAIGGVRHKGFIPWDDDIDLCILKEDEEKFLEAMVELDPETYFFQKRRTDTWHEDFYKVRKNGTTFIEYTFMGLNFHHGAFIDVFVLHGAPERGARKFLYDKLMWAYLKALGSYYITAGYPVLERTSLFLERTLYKLVDTFCNVPDSPVIAVRKGKRRVLWKRDSFGEPKFCEFEGHSFPVPNDVDTALKVEYGNYMELPPEEKRVRSHMDVSFIDLDKDYTEYPVTMEDRKKWRKGGIRPINFS
jgi:LPS biosynthesis protein